MSEATDEPLRWSLNKAAEEFGFARQTVKNRVVRAGISPECYSTRQITAALYGDKEAAEIRRANAQATLAEMECAERAKDLLPTRIVTAVWQDHIGKLKDVVSSLEMTKKERAKMMAVLRDIPISEYSTTAVEPGDEDSPEGS
jgi:hypothetical protein